jgi:hypothetical protein
MLINRCIGNVYVAISRMRNIDQHVEPDYSRYFQSVDDALSFWNDPEVRAFDPDFPWNSFVNNSHQNTCSWIDVIRRTPHTDPELAKRVYNSVMKLTEGNAGELGSSRWWTESRTIYMQAASRYHVGEIGFEEMMHGLRDIFYSADDTDYSPDGLYRMMFIPGLILVYMRRSPHSGSSSWERERNDIVDRVFRYCQKAPGGTDRQRMNEYLAEFGKECIAGNQADSYLDLLLKFTSLSHIYTYVHSVMVESMTKAITAHFLRTSPEVFVGFNDIADVDEVRANADGIMLTAARMGLCHDVGKITYANTVALCSRSVYPYEFDIIKEHVTVAHDFPPDNVMIESVRDAIFGHHKWYDGSAGYPSGFDNRTSRFRFIIDIITAADCIDAATDRIGRSYQRNRTLAEVAQEIKDQANTRYSPLVAAALESEDLLEELHRIVTDWRRQVYYRAYLDIQGQSGVSG